MKETESKATFETFELRTLNISFHSLSLEKSDVNFVVYLVFDNLFGFAVYSMFLSLVPANLVTLCPSVVLFECDLLTTY